MNKCVDFLIVVTGYSFESLEHMGANYIMSYLKKNNIDSRLNIIYPNDIDNVCERLNDPVLVGIPMFAGNAKEVLRTTEVIKSKFPNLHITVGGPATLKQSVEILETTPNIDSTIVGEGELTFLELAQRVFDQEPLEGCQGVVYRDINGNIVENENRPLICNLDELPYPDRRIFENNPATFFRIVGARGCLGVCTFCDGSGKPVQEGPWVRHRSPANIVDEMEMLYNKYKIASFQFVDPTFEDPKESGRKKASGFIEELEKRDLPVGFVVSTRAELVTEDSREYLKRLLNVGLESLYIGIEAGNTQDLKVYAKIAKIEDNLRAIKIVREEGIYLTFGFINFNPYSTHETLIQNAKFLYENKLGYMLWTYLTKLEVYPAAAIKNRLIKDGLYNPEANFLTGIHEYKFADSKVEQLISSLGNINTHLSQVLLDTKLGMLQSRVSRFSDVNEKKRFEGVFAKVDELRQRQNEKNYSFFMKCIDMSMNGANKEELDKFCIEFNNNNSYDELNDLYWKVCLRFKDIKGRA